MMFALPLAVLIALVASPSYAGPIDVTEASHDIGFQRYNNGDINLFAAEEDVDEDDEQLPRTLRIADESDSDLSVDRVEFPRHLSKRSPNLFKKKFLKKKFLNKKVFKKTAFKAKLAKKKAFKKAKLGKKKVFKKAKVANKKALKKVKVAKKKAFKKGKFAKKKVFKKSKVAKKKAFKKAPKWVTFGAGAGLGAVGGGAAGTAASGAIPFAIPPAVAASFPAGIGVVSAINGALG